MAPSLDITQNNLSNLHLSTPEATQEDEIFAVTQTVETMRAFLTDDERVENPMTDDVIDMLSKNDLIFAVRETYRRGEVLDPVVVE